MQTFAMVLALLAVGVGRPAPQAASILGSWHGTSTCVDKVNFPACRDEEVVYDVRSRAGTADTVDIRADKVVNGVREFMGELVFVRGKVAWSASVPAARVPARFEISVADSALTGRLLEVSSGRVIRRMSLRRMAVASEELSLPKRFVLDGGP